MYTYISERFCQQRSTLLGLRRRRPRAAGSGRWGLNETPSTPHMRQLSRICRTSAEGASPGSTVARAGQRGAGAQGGNCRKMRRATQETQTLAPRSSNLGEMQARAPLPRRHAPGLSRPRRAARRTLPVAPTSSSRDAAHSGFGMRHVHSRFRVGMPPDLPSPRGAVWAGPLGDVRSELEPHS